MTDDSLPRRARETRRRLDELENKHKEAQEAFIKGLEERGDHFTKTINQMLDSGEVDSEAILELSRSYDQKTDQELREFARRDQELLAALEDLRMINVEAQIEGTKLRFDAVKQQATFSAAAVAGVAAVTAGILPEQLRWVWLLWVTLGTLLLTIAVSLVLLYAESYRIEWVMQHGEDVSEHTKREWILDILYLSAFGLPLSIIAYLVFAIAKLCTF